MWFWYLFLVSVLSVTSTFKVGDENVTSTVFPRTGTSSTVLKFGGTSYYFSVVFKVNYFQATQFCNRNGMRLVSITSKEENDRLGKFAEEIEASGGHFWTSGTNLQENGDWIWLSTGVAFSYTNWYPGEPNSSGSGKKPEHCVEARTVDSKGFTWNDLPCNVKMYFICESYTCDPI